MIRRYLEFPFTIEVPLAPKGLDRDTGESFSLKGDVIIRLRTEQSLGIWVL